MKNSEWPVNGSHPWRQHTYICPGNRKSHGGNNEERTLFRPQAYRCWHCALEFDDSFLLLSFWIQSYHRGLDIHLPREPNNSIHLDGFPIRFFLFIRFFDVIDSSCVLRHQHFRSAFTVQSSFNQDGWNHSCSLFWIRYLVFFRSVGFIIKSFRFFRFLRFFFFLGRIGRADFPHSEFSITR